MCDVELLGRKLRGAAWLLPLLLAWPAHGLEQGSALPGLQVFDRTMQETMHRWDIPGASLAVAKDGKLLLAKGYGWADKEKGEPMGPHTLFRMASINKTLSAVMVLKLAEEGRLNLDDPVLPILEKSVLKGASIGDPGSRAITVRHLLQHRAGFDREISGDPFFQRRLWQVAVRQKSEPVTCEAIVKDSLEGKLDFHPGTRVAYANTGYCMLGKIIEAVSGQSYPALVSQRILLPSIGKAYQAGASRHSAPGETRYHPYPGEPLQRGAPGVSALPVPSPYGSFSMENMQALGAWIATPSDVMKFFLAIDGARGERLLSQASVRLMLEAPVFASGPSRAGLYYGMGVKVTIDGNSLDWWHDGAQPGVQTLALRAGQGYAWVVAFNMRPEPSKRAAFLRDIDQALREAATAVQHWPQGDLF